jgi:glycosyltransferase involved in cell wall biosynthesis
MAAIAALSDPVGSGPAARTPGAAPALSVVVPVFNEAANAVPLFTEIREVMTAIGRPFEVIFVNDGSTDGTLAQLCAQAAEHHCLRILDLDGNFGEAAALCAGFRAARGELVITLDGDGQNDPHDIPRLLDTLEQHGYRVVSGWRQQRQEGFMLRVLPSRLANRLIATVTGIPVHDNGCGLKVYRRDVVANAALPRGMNRFMPAIFGVTATEVAEVPVNDRRRQHGESHYGISRTVVVLRDLLVLRCVITHAERAESLWTAVAIVAAASDLYGLWRRHTLLLLLASLVVGLALLNLWNLRRFTGARAHGVFRLRREYSWAEGP